jgi:hypothetical protein
VRSVKDGLGVSRNLHGHRFAPQTPHRRMLDAVAMAKAGPPSGYLGKDLYLAEYDAIPVNDQGQVGDCTGQATRNVVAPIHLKKHGRFVLLSAMFSYSMTRIEEGTPLEEDSGCAIPDVVHGLEQRGICREEVWPTLDDGRQLTIEPSDEAKIDARDYLGLLSLHVPDDATIAACLAQGFAVSVGIGVPENMMSQKAAQTGEVVFPEPGERLLGGHNIAIIGREPSAMIGGRVGRYRCRNSWGDGWGLLGDLFFPIAFVDAGLATDGITVRDVTG